jgi:hypothetical protein
MVVESRKYASGLHPSSRIFNGLNTRRFGDWMSPSSSKSKKRGENLYSVGSYRDTKPQTPGRTHNHSPTRRVFSLLKIRTMYKVLEAYFLEEVKSSAKLSYENERDPYL